MDTVRLLRWQAASVREAWRAATDGIDEAQAFWQPPGGLSPMGAILVHASGLEDRTLQGIILGRPTVWDSGGWGRKLNAPPPRRLGAAAARAMTRDLSLVLRYGAAVATATDEFLADMTDTDAERLVHGHWCPTPVAALLSSALVGHLLPHVGEVRALRKMMGRASLSARLRTNGFVRRLNTAR